MPTPIDIGLATLERVRPDLVVVRFKPGSIANPKAFQASISARKAHFSDTPHAAVLIVPDDSDFDPGMLAKDQYKEHAAADFTLALAWVSMNSTISSILELYYALHPVPFPVKFFTLEQQALPWVETQLVRKSS